MFSYIIYLTIFNGIFPILNAWTSTYNNSVILDKDGMTYCELMCGSEPHTMCNPPTESKCPNFIPFKVEAIEDRIWHSHNGIRDRVALEYNVGNMNRLEWDYELSDMAMYWVMQCEKYKKDPCTDLPRDEDQSYTLINQNIAFLESNFLPQHFFAKIIRMWYMEKWNIPEGVSDSNNFTTFDRLNNYTQIIWADTLRIGCATAKYDNGFALVCNYHAMETLNNPAWFRGEPCSHCPRNLPLCSIYFKHLCVADTGSLKNPEPLILLVTLKISIYIIFNQIFVQF